MRGSSLAAAIALALVVACGSFGSNDGGDTTVQGGPDASSGDGPTTGGPFALVSATPADGASDVDPHAVVKLTFSAPLEPNVDPSLVKLTHGADVVEAAVAKTGDAEITITPASPLDVVAGRYAVVVDKALAAASGATLGADAHVTFTLVDGTWSAQPETVAAVPSVAAYLAVDDSARRVVLYLDDANAGKIYTADALPGQPWRLVGAMNTRGNPSQSLESLAMATARTSVLAVWNWRDYANGVYNDSHQAVFDPSTGKWSSKTFASYMPTSAVAGAALDSSPSAFSFAVGTLLTSTLEVAQGTGFVNAFDPVDSTYANGGGATGLAMDHAGHMILLAQHWATNPTIWAYTFDGTTWGGAKQLSSMAAQSALAPALASDHAGHALAAWWEHFANDDLLVSSFDGTTWSAPAPVAGMQTASGTIQLSMNDSGDALVVYMTRDTSTSTDTLWAATRPAGGAFGTPTKLAQGLMSNVVSFASAIDASGNAVVLWRPRTASNGGKRVAARYTAAKGWGAMPTPLSADDLTYGTPSVAIDAKGRVSVAWGDGTAVKLASLALP